MPFKFNSNPPVVGEERNLYVGTRPLTIGDTERAYIPDGRGGFVFGLLRVIGLCRDDPKYAGHIHMNGRNVPSNRGAGYVRVKRIE